MPDTKEIETQDHDTLAALMAIAWPYLTWDEKVAADRALFRAKQRIHAAVTDEEAKRD